MKRLTFLLALASAMSGAGALEVGGVIDGRASDAAFGKTEATTAKIDVQRAAKSFLVDRMIAPVNVTVRGENATVTTQVADMARRVESTRRAAGSLNDWRVSASNRNKRSATH